MLLLENLEVIRGNFTLRVESLTIPEGSIAAVVGPSGSGKSTLVETLVGIRKPRRGKIFFKGRNITELPPEKRNFATVYQDALLFPHLSVFENIAFGLKKRLKDKAALRRKVLEVAERVGVKHLLGRDIFGLSGGERQRVALARALAVKPELLLLDEPFSALDPPRREEMRNLLLNLVREEGISTLLVSHDVADASVADLVILLEGGEVVESGTFEKLFFRPKTPQGVRFFGLNTLEVKLISVSTSRVRVALCGYTLEVEKDFRDTPRGRAFLVFRPEAVKIGGGENTLRVDVLSEHFEGGLLKLTLRCGGQTFTASVPPYKKPLGRYLTVSIPPQLASVRIFEL